MDLGTIAATVMRTGASVGQRDERIVVTLRLVGSLLDGRARIADISPDLVRQVRAAAADAQATLILPAGPGPARIDLGGRLFVLPTGLRDALVAMLSGAAEKSAAQAPATPAALPQPRTANEMPLPTQALAVAAPAQGAHIIAAVTNALAASGALRTARNENSRAPGEAVTFETPVLDPREPAATASRLAVRVGQSGVFFEAHVAQWMRGDRTADAVRTEAQQLARVELADPTRAEARTAVQIEALHRGAVALSGPAWAGQPMQLELGRDPQVLPDGESNTTGDVPSVFFARLRLELPRLGTVEVRLRLAGESIAATVEGDGATSSAEFQQALPEFAAALTARGLRPVLLQTLAPEEIV